MKIGLLTYHSVCNFGANLQTLSTVSFFKNRGIDIFVINWYPDDLENYYSKIVSEEQQKKHLDFVEEQLPITKRCRTSEEVSKIIKSYSFDAIIVGSDAVFSYIPILKRLHWCRQTVLAYTKVSSDHCFPNPFWADFKDDNDGLKVVAMSVSAQFLDYEKCFFFEKRKIRRALQKYSDVMVRDRWTQKVINLLTGIKPEITPDPVFGFNLNVNYNISKEDIVKKYGLCEKYVLLSFCSYIVSHEWLEELYDLFHNHGYLVVNLAMPEGCLNFRCDVRIDVPLNPLDWYFIIKYSNGYIGQRMHPLIVSLHNLVPFFIFDHYVCKQDDLYSSKIYDLVDRACLMKNYCNLREKLRPSPIHVFELIVSFDFESSALFLEKYTNDYLKMMNKILDRL